MFYWSEIAKKWNRSRQQTQQLKIQDDQEQQEEIDRQRQNTHQNKYRAQWNQLSEKERDEIRQTVSQISSHTVKQFLEKKKYEDPLVMMACLAELAKRDNGSVI